MAASSDRSARPLPTVAATLPCLVLASAAPAASAEPPGHQDGVAARRLFDRSEDAAARPRPVAAAEAGHADAAAR